MTQTLQPTVPIKTPPVSAAPFIVSQEGQPRYALIDYELYPALKEEIEEWYADQRAVAAYEEWKQDPSTARPWDEIEAELTAEGFFDEVVEVKPRSSAYRNL